MNDTKSLSLDGVRFGSTVFPDPKDMALWQSLSPEEQQAVIVRNETAGARSGTAPQETLQQRLTRVRSDAV
ncbi:MAG: hypothetical protein RIM72_06820 [Alphaproteobacteria bacterium]